MSPKLLKKTSAFIADMAVLCKKHGLSVSAQQTYPTFNFDIGTDEEGSWILQAVVMKGPKPS